MGEGFLLITVGLANYDKLRQNRTLHESHICMDLEFKNIGQTRSSKFSY